ncbi:hypothetical protein ACI760_01415 [Capnocytophaga canimorsus]|uniref:hypothetical protein n=1 Tax=Capnocytophaga canimorsus TaxID=28188 RepID=UPI00385DCB8B
MKIETKYNAGDKVFFSKDGQIQCDKIFNIDIDVRDDRYTIFGGYDKDGSIKTYIKYYIIEHGFFSENELFATKEELLKSIK